MRRLAVIDLGSNTFRLVVFTARDGWWKRTDEIYEPVRIGEGIVSTHRLADKPVARALRTMDVFAHFARASGLAGDDVDAVATSAIRDADNAADFLDAARQGTGLAIRVLSREEEARYGYLAAVNSTTLADGCVLDLGGGSLQLVKVEGRLETASQSWRLGAVRMTERFLPDGGRVARKELEKLRAHVREKLAKADWLARSGPRLVGVGGTVRNLAAVTQKMDESPAVSAQGQIVSAARLEEIVERLAAVPASERADVPGVKPARADVILAGAVVVQTVVEVGGFDGIMATEAGLREGVFFERLLAGQDLPLFDDVRRSSVLNLAAQYGVEPRHTEHVAALALGLFDELADAGAHPGDPVERELLWAACVLHDIGMSVDYDDHHKHSRYLILNAGLPGFAPNEVAVIAQAARYHRKGAPSPGDLEPLFARGDAARLDRLSALLRLAEDLERSRDQLVAEAHVFLNDTDAELRLTAAEDASVQRWAASREVDLFARAFDRQLTVVQR